jgi:hypothetical protein
MSNGRELDKPAIYQIRIKGRLDPQWDDWFDGFIMEVQPDDEMLLTGTIVDQAALYGLLLKLHNLGLLLISVHRQMGEQVIAL